MLLNIQYIFNIASSQTRGYFATKSIEWILPLSLNPNLFNFPTHTPAIAEDHLPFFVWSVFYLIFFVGRACISKLVFNRRLCIDACEYWVVSNFPIQTAIDVHRLNATTKKNYTAANAVRKKPTQNKIAASTNHRWLQHRAHAHTFKWLATFFSYGFASLLFIS